MTYTRSSEDGFTNFVEIRVYGLMRSGNHAIIEWIQQQYGGHSTCFLNNVKHGDHDPYLNAEHREVTGINHDLDTEPVRKLKKRLLIYSYEDRQQLERQQLDLMSSVYQREFDDKRESYLGRSMHRFNLLIIRDPFNCFASRLKLLESLGPLGGVSDLGLITRNWKLLARRAISLARQPEPGEIVVNYNRWVLDRNYRQQLSQMLLGEFSDESFDSIPYYGGGSSFSEPVFKKPAIRKTLKKSCKLLLTGRYREVPRHIKRFFAPEQMTNKHQLFERWQHYAEHERFRQIFLDPEVIALSEELFGEIPGTRRFVMSVSEGYMGTGRASAAM